LQLPRLKTDDVNRKVTCTERRFTFDHIRRIANRILGSINRLDPEQLRAFSLIALAIPDADKSGKRLCEETAFVSRCQNNGLQHSVQIACLVA
jgi:hypothetical protein